MMPFVAGQGLIALSVCCQLAGVGSSLGSDMPSLDERAVAAPSLKVDPIYTGEVFTNARGGKSTQDATRYLGLLDLGLTLDCQSLTPSLPGHFHLLAQNTHGQGLTTDFVGDTQVVSNIDAYRNIMQVSEYWWEYSTDDDFVTFRIGKQEFNTEFMAMETASPFVQSTFGLSPSTAFPTFPNQSFGAVLILQLTDAWRLKSGIWDAFSRGGTWGFSGNSSVILAGELEYSYALGGGRLPGIFSIGAVYESSEQLDEGYISSVYEYVIQLEQALYREETGAEAEQGLSIFAGLYPRVSGDIVAEDSIGNSLVGGIVYVGLLNGRDRDCMGLGLAWAELYRGGSNEEQVTEVYYRAQITPRVTLQPDLQYIATPSGIYRDALVIGTRMQITW